MRLTLSDGGWHGPSVKPHGVFQYLLFDVEGATAEYLQLQVDEHVFSRVNPSEPHPNPETFAERLTLLALRRVAALGRERVDELLSDRDRTRYPTYAINIDERDADELRSLPGLKVCRYQRTETGDIYCSVARRRSSGSASRSSPERERGPGPTTRHLCGGCSMPDSRLACIHLHHALVEFVPGSMPSVMEAHCDIGRNEVAQDAGKCRPGGHACWVKEVEFAADEPNAASPLALHESFDYFDALWKGAFGAHILRLRGAAVAGKLATPCGSAAEFEVKLSALADIISSLDIADGDLAPAHRGDENYGKGRTLARLESALMHRVAGAANEADSARPAKGGIRALRNAMDLRRGFQHTGSGAAGKLPSAFRAFGLPYPPPSPMASWARVQGEVLRALETLREVVRGLDS